MTVEDWHESWNEARKLVSRGKITQAIEKYRAILSFCMDNNQVKCSLRCLEALTWLHIKTGQYLVARDWFKKAETLIYELDLSLTPLETFNHELNRSLLAMHYRSLEEAYYSLLLCHKIAQSVNQKHLRLRSLRFLVMVELLSGRTVEAISHANEIIETARMENRRHLLELSYAFLVLGYIAFSKGDDESFRRYFDRSIATLRRVDSCDERALLTKSWLQLLVWNEKTDDLVERLVSELENTLNAPLRLSSDLCLLIAYYYLKKGDLERYRDWWDLGNGFTDDFFTPYQQITVQFVRSQISLNDINSGSTKEVRMHEAMVGLLRARELAVRLSHSFQQVMSGLALASLYLEQHQLDQAVKMIQDVMEIARSRQWWVLAFKSEALLVELLILQNKYEEAQKKIQKFKVLRPFRPELIKHVNLTLLEESLHSAQKLSQIGSIMLRQSDVRSFKIKEIQNYIQECMSIVML